jgi:3-methyladenine DNA glycosylase Tag
MRSFSQIVEIAASRHGAEAIETIIASARPTDAAALAAIPDDRWLAMATRCIFQSGFNWKVIEAKWPGFEEAFEGFAIPRWTLASDDDIAALLSDRRIVRNGVKISTVPNNARYIARVSRDHGGFGRFIADWPADDHVGLLRELDKGGDRLGGATGQYFLRFMGRDSFILSRDVTAALVREGVIEKPATSARALAAVQSAFNGWRAETGLPLTAISQVLARSIDG